MKVETYIILDREEINKQIPYALVCETMSGARWNTGRRKRMIKEQFAESEINAIYRLHKQAYNWYLVKGAPEELKIAPHTLILWQRLAEFCCSL